MAVAWAVPLSSRQLEVSCRESVGPMVATGSNVALARSVDGAIGLAWMECGAAQGGRLLFASWDRMRGAWADPSPVPAMAWCAPLDEGASPVLALGAGGRVAVAVRQDGAWMVCLSPDAGHTWSEPSRLAAGDCTLALAVLSDGRTLGVWRSPGGELLFRVVEEGAPALPVCDELAAPGTFALVPLLDGSALLTAWMSSAGGVEGLAARAFDGVMWRPATWVSKDVRRGGWDQLWVVVAADGPQMGAFWSEGAAAKLSWSSDGGRVWTLPQDCGRALSCGAIARMRDGSVYVVSSDGAGLLLRRYNALGGGMVPASLGQAGDRTQVVVECEDSVVGPGSLLLVRADRAGRVVSTRVLLPTAAVLAEMDADCDCLEGRVAAAGYPLKGRVLVVERAGVPRVRIWQHGVFGLMREGELVARVAPRTMERLASGQAFFARLEQRGGEWWLFDVRLLGASH